MTMIRLAIMVVDRFSRLRLLVVLGFRTLCSLTLGFFVLLSIERLA